MKNRFKLIGVIAVVAVIGFSMAACDMDPGGGGDVGGGLAAPSGLTATAISSSEIQLTWKPVAGAVGYNLYNSLNSSSGFQLAGTVTTNSATNNNLPSNTTVYYRVAAFTGNGTQGKLSNTASAKTLGSGNYALTLDGVWWSSSGEQITVSGSTGTVTSFGSLNTLGTDAKNKGYYKLGDQKWRSLKSTGSLKWSGQTLHIRYNTSSPDVAIGTTWTDCTITMSADGQTITFESTTSSGDYSFIYTRIYTPPTPTNTLDGVWWSSGGEQITVTGSTGIVDTFGSMNSLGIDAVSKNYLKLGDQKWKNLTGTGYLTWSGETLHITYNTSNPGVATGTRWRACKITMSEDGQTITFESADSDGPYSYTYTRIYTPPASGITSVYITGNYQSSGSSISKPCYWVNGVRTDLVVPAGKSGYARNIAVSGNKVYVCGEYYEQTGTYMPTACYWVNGVRTDMQGVNDVTFYETREIAVVGDTVYVAGQYRYGTNNNTRRACFWINGAGNSLPTSPTGRNSDTIGIYVEGTTVYILGVHGPTDDTRVCYWGVDGVLEGTASGACDLPSGSGSDNHYSTPGAMVKTPDTISIYLPGDVKISNVQRACYWRNGNRTDLPVPSGTTFSVNYSMTTAGTTIYAAGRYETGSKQTACYWKDGTTRTDLTVAGSTITRAGDIAVLGTNVYVAGSYGNSLENRKACYWANGNKTDLSIPAGAALSAASAIVVVER